MNVTKVAVSQYIFIFGLLFVDMGLVIFANNIKLLCIILTYNCKEMSRQIDTMDATEGMHWTKEVHKGSGSVAPDYKNRFTIAFLRVFLN